jgi:hypothetical protein
MINIRKSAILAGVAMAAFAVASQDGLLIRRALQEGASDTYKVETVTKQVVNLPNGMGEQEMDTTLLATYQVKTGKVDAAKKSAAVELIYTIDKMEADGALGGMMGGAASQTGKPTTVAGTLDELGRVKMELPKDGNAATAAMISGAQSMGTSMISVELPEKAVKIGDTWEIIVPKSPFTGPTDQKLIAKLVGEKEVDGKPAYVITTEGAFKTDADLSKMAEEAPGPMKGQKMLMKGTIDLKSDGVVEKGTGRTLRVTTKMKMKQTLELPDMGFTVDTTGTTTTVVTLK